MCWRCAGCGRRRRRRGSTTGLRGTKRDGRSSGVSRRGAIGSDGTPPSAASAPSCTTRRCRRPRSSQRARVYSNGPSSVEGMTRANRVPRIRRSVSSSTSRSPGFSHEAEVGVKWTCRRRSRASHCLTAACLCGDGAAGIFTWPHPGVPRLWSGSRAAGPRGTLTDTPTAPAGCGLRASRPRPGCRPR